MPFIACRNGSKRERKDCFFSHTSPAGGQHMVGDKRAACKYGMRCTKGNCAFSHPSPSLNNRSSDGSDSESEYDSDEYDSDAYECCGRTFRTKRALEQHQDAKHPPKHRSEPHPSPPSVVQSSRHEVLSLADSQGLPPAPSSTSVVQSSSNCPEADTTAQEEERLSAEKAFNKAVENEGTSLNSSRLCLVGQGRAGKTALANALINKEFKHTDSTVGVSQRFLEVDKLDLAAGDDSQWNVLGADTRFVMSQQEALALQAAKIKFLEESTISLPEETKVKMLQKRQGTENINVAELLTDEVRDDEDDNSRELQHSSREGGRDVSAQDAIHTETANTLDSKTSFGGYSSHAAVGCIQDLPASYQRESPGNTPLKKDFSSSMEEVIKHMNMELPDLRSGKKEPLRISLWDYGGQDKFIGMHHLYLSRYCVFLLVFNMKWLLPDACEKDECLEYLTAWLNSISMHAVDRKDKSQAPILIIGTHKDEVPSPEDHSNISKILDDKFSYHRAWATVEEFKKAQGKEGRGIRLSFFPVDNTCGHQDDVLKQMQSEVLKVVEREKYVKRKVYYTWLEAYKTLQEESKTKPFLEFEKVKDICSASGMGTHLELNHETDIMLKFFHQMGLIMYHDEKTLKHLVILDPAKFLVEPASRVVCQIDIDESASFAPDEKRRVLMRKLKSQKPHQYDDLRKGILHRQILWEFLWSDVADNRDELEVLMTKYQLMVPLANKVGNEDRFLVPGSCLSGRQTKSTTTVLDLLAISSLGTWK